MLTTYNWLVIEVSYSEGRENKRKMQYRHAPQYIFVIHPEWEIEQSNREQKENSKRKEEKTWPDVDRHAQNSWK